MRWYVAAFWAASVGEIESGRNATRNFEPLVSPSSAAVTSQASSAAAGPVEQ